MGWLSSARKKEEGDEIFSNVFQKWRFVSLSLLGPLRIRAFYNEEILFKKKYFLYVTIMDQKRAVEYIKMWYLSTVRSIVC